MRGTESRRSALSMILVTVSDGGLSSSFLPLSAGGNCACQAIVYLVCMEALVVPRRRAWKSKECGLGGALVHATAKCRLIILADACGEWPGTRGVEMPV
jgi:hypothetical protein